MGSEVGPRPFQDHMAEVLFSSGAKTLCMTWLHDASTPSLQDQKMVGAIRGLEDFLSKVSSVYKHYSLAIAL